MPRFIDLSHVIEDGSPAFPGLPRAKVEAIWDHAASRPRYGGRAEFYLGRIELAMNTGTYIDAPFHRHRDGDDCAAVSLEAVAGLDGLVLDAAGADGPALDFDCALDDLAGRAVLIKTGRDALWGAEGYLEPGPYLSQAFVDKLIEAGAALVGVDFLNVDDMTDPARPVHTRLLAESILIVENLKNLDALPAAGFKFSAVPLKIKDGASMPVRAYAEVED